MKHGFRRMTAREMDQYRLAITGTTVESALDQMRDRLLSVFPDDHGAKTLVRCIQARQLSIHSPLPLHDAQRVWTDLSPYQESLLLEELSFQLDIAVAALDEFHARRLSGGHSPVLWQFVYGVLGAASRISQILIGRRCRSRKEEQTNRTAVGRALFMRNALGVGAMDTLLSRSARDHLEHFDERLDSLLAPGKAMHFDRDVPAPDPHDPEILPRVSRAITKEGLVIVQGQSYDLSALVAAAKALRDRIAARQEVISEIIFRTVEEGAMHNDGAPNRCMDPPERAGL